MGLLATLLGICLTIEAAPLTVLTVLGNMSNASSCRPSILGADVCDENEAWGVISQAQGSSLFDAASMSAWAGGLSLSSVSVPEWCWVISVPALAPQLYPWPAAASERGQKFELCEVVHLQ